MGDQAPPRKAFTLRALGLGLLLAVVVAAISPWESMLFSLYNYFLPPVVLVVLVVFGAVVNPLLGPRLRFSSGELVVIAGLLLAVGGAVGGGLQRLPTVIAGGGRALAEPGAQLLAQPATEAQQAAARARLEAVAQATTDDPTAAAEQVEQRLRRDPQLMPEQRWTLPTGLFLGVPEAGRVPRSDPEFRYLVEGHFQGLPREQPPRVGHRSTVTWRSAAGEETTRLALGGLERDRHLAAGEPILDLDATDGDQVLRGRRAGDRVELAGGEVELLEVAPPPLPWIAWLLPLLAWSPFVLGAVVAMVSLAALVRRQWAEHERLPYPIAQVAWSLCEEAEPGRRLSPLLRSSAFRTALLLAAGIISWKGLFAYGLLPLDIPLTFDCTAFAGEAWLWIPHHWLVLRPTIYISVVALIFFLTPEVSFSMWSLFLVSHLGAAWLAASGLEVDAGTISRASGGGFLAMIVAVLWIGRAHYLGLLRAAVWRHPDPALREAAPWVWSLLAGMGAMLAMLLAAGSAFAPALLAVLLCLGLLLVVARIAAEAGLPFVSLPLGLNELLLPIFGATVPAAALLPAALVAITAAGGDRMNLLGYAVHADDLAARAKLPPNRFRLLLIGGALLALVVGISAMLFLRYEQGGAWRDGGYPEDLAAVWKPVIGVAEAAAGSREPPPAGWGDFAGGATAAAVFSAARLHFTWWPLHPVGILTMGIYPLWRTWFSVFLGWLAKVLVVRYGGEALYRRLKPAAVGLAVGEALAIAGFTLARMIAEWYGVELPFFLTLP